MMFKPSNRKLTKRHGYKTKATARMITMNLDVSVTIN